MVTRQMNESNAYLYMMRNYDKVLKLLLHPEPSNEKKYQEINVLHTRLSSDIMASLFQHEIIEIILDAVSDDLYN